MPPRGGADRPIGLAAAKKNHAMTSATVQSFLRRHLAPRQPSTLRGRGAGRAEVCPPKLPRAHWWVALYRWLMASSVHEAVSGFWSASHTAAPRDALLEEARHEFFEAVDSFDTPRAFALAETIDAARSRQELWHLRGEVFALVSQHRDQAEAEERLARLNRFFPTRAPRSGFAALEQTR
jgi:hypothetical protein